MIEGAKLILAIDTCGTEGTVALGRADSIGLHRLGQRAMAGKTYSSLLVQEIAALLEESGSPLAALDAIAVVHGPGSFTGMRVGVAAAKALAEAAQKRLIAISRLEVLARKSAAEGLRCAMLDAGRGEVYAGVYRGAERVSEALETRSDAAASVREAGCSAVLCEEELREAFAEASAEFVAAPAAGDALAIALERLKAGRFDDVAALEANYIRRSDAEIFSKPALTARLAAQPE